MSSEIILDIPTLERIKLHYTSSARRKDEIVRDISELLDEAQTFSERLDALEKISAINLKEKFMEEQAKMLSKIIEEQKKLQEKSVNE